MCDSRSERGATVVIVAMLMVAMIICAAFAVDFGSWYTRAEKLQNAADAAALASASSYSRDGDEVAAVSQANEVLRQNGVEPNDSDIDIVVTFPSTTEVAVEVRDTDVALFFSRIIRTDAMNIKREAIAKLDRCAASCAQTIPIPRPFSSIDVTGSGDGFVPILIGDRVYAINHHIWGDIVCIDLETGNMCAGYPQLVQPDTPGLETQNIVSAGVFGNKIFYSGQTRNRPMIACFNVETESACVGSPVGVGNLPRGTGFASRSSRIGATTLIDDRVYAFTDDNQVHCYLTVDLSPCANYPQSDGLEAAGVPARTGRSDSASMSDRLVDDNDRIYVATHYSGGPHASYGVQLHCWDTIEIEPCDGFATNEILTTSNRWTNGRLFFNRDTSGTIIGVCATANAASHSCVDLAGQPTAGIANFHDDMDRENGLHGLHTYHEPTNRLLINGGLFTSTTYCWDFNTSASCGRITGGDTKDYGYDYRGNCIYALGDASIFWTFDITMSSGCREGTATAVISPCICADGDRYWGAVRFVGDDDLLSVDGPFENFDVSIFDPNDHSVPLFTGSMLGSTGELDLAGIPTTFSTLDIEVFVRMKLGEDPWADGNGPAVEVGWTDKPHLVD